LYITATSSEEIKFLMRGGYEGDYPTAYPIERRQRTLCNDCGLEEDAPNIRQAAVMRRSSLAQEAGKLFEIAGS